MRARYEPGAQLSTPFVKEPIELSKLVRGQGGEPGERRAPMAVKRRRHPPHPAAPLAKLALLHGAVFMESIGGVRDHGMYGTRGSSVEPPKRLRMKQGRATEMEGRAEGFLGGGRQWKGQVRRRGGPIEPAGFSCEQAGSVEGKVRLYRRARNEAGDCAQPVADFHHAERRGRFVQHLEYGIAHLARRSSRSGLLHGSGVWTSGRLLSIHVRDGRRGRWGAGAT